MSTKLYAKRNILNFPFVTFHLQRLLYLLFFGDTHTINKTPFGSCHVTFHSSVTFISYAKLFIFIVPQYMNITTNFFTLKLLFFSFSSCFDYWAVHSFFEDWTGNVNRFRGFLVPRPDWIKVLYLFGTIGLHRLLTKTLKFSKKLKISKKFSKFLKFQFSKNFKIFKTKFKISKKFKVQNFKIFTKFQKFQKISKFQKFHKTCSHHVHLCWSLLSQKNQTLMNDWGNSITMSMRQYSDL